MRKNLVLTLVTSIFLIGLSFSPLYAIPTPKDGGLCSKIKQQQKFQQVRYTCIKVGKNLIWRANKSDLLAKLDRETKAKAASEAEAKTKLLAIEKERLLQSLQVTFYNKPKELDFPNQKSYILAERRWYGWKWNLTGNFEDRGKIPAGLQVVFQAPELIGVSQEVITQNEIRCLNVKFISKSYTWASLPTGITCTPLGNKLFRVNIDNLQYNVGYEFELIWQLADGTLGTRVTNWLVIAPGAFDEATNPCRDFSCIVPSYRGDSSLVPY